MIGCIRRISSLCLMVSIFWRTNWKFCRKRCFFSSFFEVMSASQSIIRSSMSLPASKARRRTALSVTSSSAMTCGRMWSPTNFCTYFIFSFMGSFILRKMSGIIFSPTKLWLWNVQPATGSQRLVLGLPMSCSKAAQRSQSTRSRPSPFTSSCVALARLSSTCSVW